MLILLVGGVLAAAVLACVCHVLWGTHQTTVGPGIQASDSDGNGQIHMVSRRDDPLLSKRVPQLRLRNVPMDGAAMVLRQLGFPVCIENAAVSDRDTQYACGRCGTIRARRVFSLIVENQRLDHVLDQLVALDPEYRWESVENGRLVNIVPKESTTSWHLRNVRLEDVTIYEALNLPLVRHRGTGTLSIIRDCELGAPFEYPWSRRVTLASDEITFREFLNKLAVQHENIYWRYACQNNSGTVIVDWLPAGRIKALAEIGRRAEDFESPVDKEHRNGRLECFPVKK